MDTVVKPRYDSTFGQFLADSSDILYSRRDNGLYIGCTNDIRKRISQHNSGKVFSTRGRVPFQLIYYEMFIDKKDAFAREKWLKTGWGHNQINKILYMTLKNLGG